MRRRTNTVITAVAAVIALWLGLTAPHTSPVVPPPPPAPIQIAVQQP